MAHGGKVKTKYEFKIETEGFNQTEVRTRMRTLTDKSVCKLGTLLFVAFVEDNATMSSIPYFENRVSYFV